MAEPGIIGRRLKAWRLRRGLSQNQLWQRSGVPRPTIVAVENGNQASISVENAIKLADALGITVDALVRDDVLDAEHAAAIV